MSTGPESMVWSGLPNSTESLDMSKYELRTLPAHAFNTAQNIVRLDLQNNGLEHIEEGTFEGMGKLTHLILSKNQLEVLTEDMFTGLDSLQKLLLDDNILQTVEVGAFEGLRKLRLLDLSRNPFICDCNLAPFLQWLDENKAAVNLANPAETRCAEPSVYADVPLFKINPTHLPCSPVTNWPTAFKNKSLPSTNLHIFPDDSQVVFEGDSLLMKCWVANEIQVENGLSWHIRGRSSSLLPNTNVRVESNGEVVLSVSSIGSAHSGEWTCLKQGSGRLSEDSNTPGLAGPLSGVNPQHKSASILVITKDTKLCPPKETKTAQGTYRWPATIGGNTVQQRCVGNSRNFHSRTLGFAYLLCRENGAWGSTNTSQCPFVSHTTETLYKMATMNTTMTPETLIQSAEYFINFTSNPDVFKNEMDVVFYSKAVANYLPYLHDENKLGPHVISMVENVLEIDPALLLAAEEKDGSLTRLQHVVSNVTVKFPAFHYGSTRLAVGSYSLLSTSATGKIRFEGLTCSWYSTGFDHYQVTSFAPAPLFHCTASNKTISTTNKMVLASVSLPQSLYAELSSPTHGLDAGVFTFAVYGNASLFPHPDLKPIGGNSVIGATYLGQRTTLRGPLQRSVTVSIRAPMNGPKPNPKTLKVMYWSQKDEVVKGKKGWVQQPCHFISVTERAVVNFRCNRLGFYTYIDDNVPKEDAALPSTAFQYHHYTVYIGSGVCLILLFGAQVLYGLAFPVLQIAAPLKHALINFWFGTTNLILIFTSGAHQTEHELTCKTVGFLLHYFSLCSLVWLVLGVYFIYRIVNEKVSAQCALERRNLLGGNCNAPRGLLDRSEVERTKRNEPYVGRLYILGWGTAMLICSLTAAFNTENYGLNFSSKESYCFMRQAPFLGGLVVPTAILTAMLLGFGLSAWCAASSESRPPGDGSSSKGLIVDNEKTVQSLLLAYVFIFVMLVSTWMWGALSVILPFDGEFQYEQLIFGVSYLLSSVSMSVFIALFWCTRQDIRRFNQLPDANMSYDPGPGTSLEDITNLANNSFHQQQQHQKAPSQLSNYGHGESQASGGAGTLRGHDTSGYKIYEAGAPGAMGSLEPKMKNYSRIQASRKGNNSSEDISDVAIDLNPMGHLRRRGGYTAPANSVLASEAEYGVYGPPSSVARDSSSILRPEGYSSMPTTSSPVPMMVNPMDKNEMTTSPLLYPNNRDTQEVFPEIEEEPLEYTEMSTIKLGAPCQMATFVDDTNNESRMAGAYRQQRGDGQFSFPQHRGYAEDTRSRLSAMSKSSNRSSRGSSGAYRPHKRPQRRRKRSSANSDTSNAVRVNNMRNVNKYSQPSAYLDDDYLGDDDHFDTLERQRNEVQSTEGLRDVAGNDAGSSSSQLPESLEASSGEQSRETCV